MSPGLDGVCDAAAFHPDGLPDRQRVGSDGNTLLISNGVIVEVGRELAPL